MKNLLLTLLALSTYGASQAATVIWNANIDTGVITAGSASSAPALALGNWVQVGYFKTLSDSAVAAGATTSAGTAALAADFFTFGSLQLSASGSNTANSGLGAAGVGGWQQTTNNFLYSSNPTFAAGHQLYFWAMNSTDNSSLSAAQASVTQQAIFSLPSWTFPASDLGTTNIDITSLSSASRLMLAGSYLPTANNTNLAAVGFGAPAVQLATVSAIPEPSRVAFLGLALCGMFWHRRRR